MNDVVEVRVQSHPWAQKRAVGADRGMKRGEARLCKKRNHLLGKRAFHNRQRVAQA